MAADREYASPPDYLFGECVAFALAARRILCWPLVVFADCDPTAVDPGPVHAAVAHPEGVFFDASGPVSESVIAERYGIRDLEIVRHPAGVDESAFGAFVESAEVDAAAAVLRASFVDLVARYAA